MWCSERKRIFETCSRWWVRALMIPMADCFQGKLFHWFSLDKPGMTKLTMLFSAPVQVCPEDSAADICANQMICPILGSSRCLPSSVEVCSIEKSKGMRAPLEAIAILSRSLFEASGLATQPFARCRINLRKAFSMSRTEMLMVGAAATIG